jgi:hypothetical protein
MFNAYWEPLSFELPLFPGAGSRPWRRWLDTFLEAPNDICAFTDAPSLEGFSYLMNPRSIVRWCESPRTPRTRQVRKPRETKSDGIQEAASRYRHGVARGLKGPSSQ